jgi:hypothetical protein
MIIWNGLGVELGKLAFRKKYLYTVDARAAKKVLQMKG